MTTTIILAAIAIISMFICVIRFPMIKIKGLSFDTFYLPPLVIALVLIIFDLFDKTKLIETISTNSSFNPLTILVLFICVSLLSIALDETGFFSFIAAWFVKKFNKSQYMLFFILYALISVLTIFTSNDIVILTFTPFILYFSKKGNINPIPFLVMEFVCANTYSMLLPIGNPTNIYLTSIFEIDFISYIKVMILPTILCGIGSTTILLLLFKKSLDKKIEVFDIDNPVIKNKPLCIISLCHLGITTILLVIANYINIDMWKICLIFAISLLIFLSIFAIIHKNANYVFGTVKRLPYNLIPFILSMFTIIMALDSYNIFSYVYNLMDSINNDILQRITYLVSSTISCNILNNIPMTLAYGSILSYTDNVGLIYATIIGSNLGAIITPIGALAGIMWIRILKFNNIKYSFLDFMKNGVIIVIVLIVMTSIGLFFI